MKLKNTLIFVTSLAICSFQIQASLCNGGFEDGLTCWGGLTEEFGYKEVISSYTDGRGITFSPTEGTSFVNLWGSNDLAQRVSWEIGDQVSFDWATALGTNPNVANTGLFAGLFDGLTLIRSFGLSQSNSDTTVFNTFSYTFTEDSPEFGTLAFQALGTQPTFGLTDAEVGHILIDNVQFAPGSAMPEPDTAFLIGAALLLGLNNRIARKRPIQKIIL